MFVIKPNVYSLIDLFMHCSKFIFASEIRYTEIFAAKGSTSYIFQVSMKTMKLSGDKNVLKRCYYSGGAPS